MSLKHKASMIDLDLGSQPTEVAPSTPVGQGGDDGVPRRKSGVAAIQQTIGTMHRIADLEAEVAELRSAERAVKLDPATVRSSKWRNRQDVSFSGPAFQRLKDEIQEAGGNVQPIKVRRVRIAGNVEFLEVVFGRRRLRACLELGLPVLALIVELSDPEAFVEAERENRNREDLSAWEQGLFYLDALNQGLFPSQRKLAASLSISNSVVSEAVRLASLPANVVAAFPSPLDLQFRWATDLEAAVAAAPDEVNAEAKAIESETPRPGAKAVLERLLRAGLDRPSTTGKRQELMVGGRAVGAIVVGQRGMTLKLGSHFLNQKFELELRKLLAKYTDT